MPRLNKMNLIYRGYVTNDVEKAIAEYEKKVGEAATVVVARPGADLVGENALVVRSAWGMVNCLFVTHLLTPKQFAAHWGRRKSPSTSMTKEPPGAKEITLIGRPVPDRKAGRPKASGGVCPMCSQRIGDFNRLGFWWGWEKGISPPYWEELEQYIFNRDDYTCQKCHSRLPEPKLAAHHIDPKETGGADSARNLITLCKECHLDTKPIFDDEDIT